MCQHLRSFLLAASLALFAGSASLGAPICRPDLSFKNVNLSELKNLQRTWTATLNIDASRCTDTLGNFEIRFVREKENAPELEFNELFVWQTGPLHTGQIEVSLDFWVDEAVLQYALDYVWPCGCRGDSVRLLDRK
jgi:hypothetical protein